MSFVVISDLFMEGGVDYVRVGETTHREMRGGLEVQIFSVFAGAGSVR